MLMKKFSVFVFVLLVSASICVPAALAELNASKSDQRDVIISGTRQSSIAWGQNGDNYQVGAVASERFPNQGWIDISINTQSYSSFGDGSGYKMYVQFWNDSENYVAFGIIKDPGAAPWGGVTVMVEGNAYGQPIGGYWPQGHGEFDSSGDDTYYHFSVHWYPDRIEFVIDHLTDQRMIYNINMSNPSFACLGAARLPGDSLHGIFQLHNFSMDNDDTQSSPHFTLVTWDPQFTVIGNITY
jgi:hypothetical protein